MYRYISVAILMYIVYMPKWSTNCSNLIYKTNNKVTPRLQFLLKILTSINITQKSVCCLLSVSFWATFVLYTHCSNELLLAVDTPSSCLIFAQKNACYVLHALTSILRSFLSFVISAYVQCTVVLDCMCLFPFW